MFIPVKLYFASFTLSRFTMGVGAFSWKQLFIVIIIHHTHYEKSDWSRAFNQFKIACELDMINPISAADIAFIMSSSTSAWLLIPLECSPQKQNGFKSFYWLLFSSAIETYYCFQYSHRSQSAWKKVESCKIIELSKRLSTRTTTSMITHATNYEETFHTSR